MRLHLHLAAALVLLSLAASPVLAWRGMAISANADTVGVKRGRTWRCVRLFGIAVPPAGKHRTAARALVFNHLLPVVKVKGRPVYVATEVTVTPVTRDREGILLAKVAVGRRGLNEALLEAGLAWYDPRRGEDRRYAALAAGAQAGRKGLWAEARREPPWKERARLDWDRIDPLGPDLFEAVTVEDAGRVHGNPESRQFHTVGCAEFLCAGCSASFEGAAAALRAGHRPHSCVRFVSLNFGPPPGGGSGACRRDRDCVFSYHRCSPCPACKPSWPAVENRAAHRRERAHHRRHPVKCAPCRQCPCGQSLRIPARPVCRKGRCQVQAR
jgi:hypothetical protein